MIRRLRDIVAEWFREYFTGYSDQEIGRMADPIDPSVEAVQDLNRFECLAAQAYWDEAEVRDGCQLTVANYVGDDDQEYWGYVEFSTVQGIDFLQGFLNAAYALDGQHLLELVEQLEEDQKGQAEAA